MCETLQSNSKLSHVVLFPLARLTALMDTGPTEPWKLGDFAPGQKCSVGCSVNSVNFLFLRCREECIKCTSNDICTECAPFHFLTPDMTCSKTCPDGYYPAGDPSESGGVCTKCVEPCLLCTSAERPAFG